jgi:hypothetical protein
MRRALAMFCLTVLATGALPGCGVGPVEAVGLLPGTLGTDLVAHWTFDDGSGSQVRDSSGFARDGALNGTTWTWLAQGRFGGALHMQQGDYVQVDGFPNATPGWTVSAWVQIASADIGMGEASILGTEDVFKGGWEMKLTTSSGSNEYHFGYWIGPGQSDYAFYSCLQCIVPDHWQHLTAVVDGTTSTLAFYLDGELRSRKAWSRLILPGVPTLYMGRWATTNPPRLFIGALDDVAIWSRPLMSDEIALLQQAAAP